MHGKFEEADLKPHIGKESIKINGLTFELTQYKRDKNARAHAPVWMHNVEGGSYLIYATPYLNGDPALQLSINYVEDPYEGDTRDISYREHHIGDVVSYEPIKTFKNYRDRVMLLASQVLNEYLAIIQKQYQELTKGMYSSSEIFGVADPKNISIEDVYPYMGNDSITVRGIAFDFILEEDAENKHAVWYSLRKNEKNEFVHEYKVYATPNKNTGGVVIEMYNALGNEIGYIGYPHVMLSYAHYKEVVREHIDEILGNLADDEEQNRYGGFEE